MISIDTNVREVASAAPDLLADAQLGHRLLQLPEHLPLALAARPAPQLEEDQRAEPGGPRPQHALHAGPNGRVAVRPQEVDPGRGVHQDHR
jgi:hypothetical protein